MAELAAVKVTVYGRVQGVFFRAFVSRWAEELGLTGYVWNLPGGNSVEVQAEGERQKIAQLIRHVEIGPPGARVIKVVTHWSGYTGKYSDFRIRY